MQAARSVKGIIVIFDARGTPVTLLCAGAYTADCTRSFNVAIPLRRP